MKKNKILIGMVILLFGLITIIGCQQQQGNVGQEEKKPVMDSEIAGEWVNDETPDIIYYFDEYDFSKCYVSAQGRVFPARVKLISDDYLSVDDLSSDKSFFNYIVKNVNSKKDHEFFLVFNTHYADGKLNLKYKGFVAFVGGDNERSEEFEYLRANLTGSYTKK